MIIKVPLLLLVGIGSLLYALVNVFHPDWLIRSNFRLRRSDNLHKDSHQNSWICPRVKSKGDQTVKGIYILFNPIFRKVLPLFIRGLQTVASLFRGSFQLDDDMRAIIDTLEKDEDVLTTPCATLACTV